MPQAYLYVMKREMPWAERTRGKVMPAPIIRHEMNVVRLLFRQKPKLRQQAGQSLFIQADLKRVWIVPRFGFHNFEYDHAFLREGTR